MHLDGKFWRTLPLLAWQPGKLTREYIDGRRASYISPIALFLFVVLLSFALFDFANDAVKFDRHLAPGAATGLAAAESRIGEETGGTSAGQASRALAAVWHKAQANPALLLYKLQSNAYKYCWLLILISVPLMWLLFPFSRRHQLYDHTVFVAYSISFMLVLGAVSSLAAAWKFVPLAILLPAYAPFHLYRHLRGAYALKPISALWRMIVLLGLIGLALIVFFASVLGLAMG